MKKLTYLFALVVLISSCGKNSSLIIREDQSESELSDVLERLSVIPTLSDYNRALPHYLQTLGMEQKTPDNLKVGLGRVIFYDKNLSKDRSISCASCHKQAKAFSDDVAFSVGVNGHHTARNSSPLANVASFSAHYSAIGGKTPLLFWDERAPTVAAQSRQTFANPVEMDMDMTDVVAQIKEQPYYPYLWKQVYGDFAPSETQVLECLQEFVGSLGGAKSRLDQALELALDMLNIPTSVQTDTIISSIYTGGNGENTVINTVIGLPGLSLEENLGRDIFVNNCSKCHSPVRPFQEVFAACNGLDMNYTDKGLFALTGKPEDEGVFKSPSLRNIALTAPYMHDGRFKTLKEVVDFYSDQVKPHPNLHAEMLHKGDRNLHLTEVQKQNLVAFLKTFTDNSIASDGRFSNPFK